MYQHHTQVAGFLTTSTMHSASSSALLGIVVVAEELRTTRNRRRDPDLLNAVEMLTLVGRQFDSVKHQDLVELEKVDVIGAIIMSIENEFRGVVSTQTTLHAMDRSSVGLAILCSRW